MSLSEPGSAQPFVSRAVPDVLQGFGTWIGGYAKLTGTGESSAGVPEAAWFLLNAPSGS
jgi:hypothetical protein